MGDKFVTGTVAGVWLTSDGTSTGLPCKARLEGEEAYRSAYVDSQRTALDFTVHTQVSNRGKAGIEFTLILDFTYETVLASILTALDAAMSSGTPVRVTLSHLEVFDVYAMPLSQQGRLYTFTARSLGIAQGVRIRFISTASAP